MNTTPRIDYDHAKNGHGETGPRRALPLMLDGDIPVSLLDVGCGLGAWTKAALGLGIKDVVGIDGIDIDAAKLWFPSSMFQRHDLSRPLDLGRTFEAVLCLEVAEHLENYSAPVLVRTLTRHAPRIFFSAAVPGQSGQHHVNCQWPVYWQTLFNREGFVCEDRIRWMIWNAPDIEPWYRQNLFVARHDPDRAGKEPRIPAVRHPDMPPDCDHPLSPGQIEAIRDGVVAQIETGSMPAGWYPKVLFKAVGGKLRRHLSKN